MAQTASDQHELTLVELLRGFIEFASLQGKKSFPQFNDRLWHEFLYFLKDEHRKEFPQLACIGKFDWDGPYPKCRNLEEVMFGLHNICYTQFPETRISLIRKTTTEVSLLLLHYPDIAVRAVEIASTFPGFFER